MDNISSNLIITVILTMVIVIPIMIINKNSKKKRRLLNQDYFGKTASDNKLKIPDADYFASKIIGIDPVKGFLLFVDFYRNEPEVCLVDLKKAGACGINKQTGSNGSLSEISLVFENKTNSKLIFYRQYRDKESDCKLLGEKAEMWKQQLNQKNI